MLPIDIIYVAEVIKRLGVERGVSFLDNLSLEWEKLAKFSDLLELPEAQKLLVRLGNMNLLRPQKKLVPPLIPTHKYPVADLVITAWNKLGLTTVMSRSPRRLRKIGRFIHTEKDAQRFIKSLTELVEETPVLRRTAWFDIDYVFRSDNTFEKVVQKRVYIVDESVGRSGKKLSKEVMAFCEIGLRERNAIALWEYISNVKVNYESKAKGLFPMFSVICKAVKLAECNGEASGSEVLEQLDRLLGRTTKESYTNYTRES